MATYTRTNIDALAWDNTTTAWTPTGGYPSTTADLAQFTNTITAVNRTTPVTATIGQIEVVAPGGLVTILAATAQILTLNPSVSYNSVGIKFTGSTGNTLTLSVAVVLACDQTWDFGTSKKALTVSGAGNALSGPYNLTLTGGGQFFSSLANTFGGVGKTVTLQNGMVCVPGNANTFGDANNTIYVGPTASLDLQARTLAQTNYYVTGTGTIGNASSPVANYGAINLGSTADTKNIFVTGASSVIQMFTAALAAKITGTMSLGGYIEFSANANPSSGFTNTANDFYAPGGEVRISSFTTAGVAVNRGYNVGATDAAAGGANEPAPFGDTQNVIRIMPSGKIYAAPASVTRTVARNITFDGHSANTHMQNAGTGATGTLAFSGDLTFSGNATNAAEASATSTNGGILYSGTIAGPGAIRLVTGGSKYTFDSVKLNPFASWSGELQSPSNITTVYKNGYASLVNKRTTLVPGTGNTISMFLVNGLDADITLQHSSYYVDADLVVSCTFAGRTFSLGTGAISSASGGTNFYIPSTSAANTTVLLPGNISAQLVFGLSGSDSATGTLVVSGTNVRSGSFSPSCGWTGANNLCVNSDGAFGAGSAGGDNIVITSTGTLDNTSGSAKTLTNGGAKNFNANFSWAGTNDLSLGLGNVTTSADRKIGYSGAGTGTLKAPGAITTTTATTTWDFGNSSSGAKQRFTLGGANASLTATTTADQHAVTAGYFRIENANGLGAAGSTTAWWVGATNGGVVTTGAALELYGSITTPNVKNVNLYGVGPGTGGDGALRSVSGTNTFEGSVGVPNVAGTRIQVDADTFTLGTTLYDTIAPINAGTPLKFTALSSSATLNQNRSLTSTVGAVNVNNGGSGTVVLAHPVGKPNAYTGLLTAEGGTAKLTGTGSLSSTSTGTTVYAGATVQIDMAGYKATFPGTTTLGQAGVAKAKIRIGA